MSLKPGVYLKTARGIKSLSLLDPDAWSIMRGPSPTPQTIAATIGWVWIALNKRAQIIGEIEWEIQRGETVLAPDAAPIVHDWYTLFQRVDLALQTVGSAYLLKQRNRGGRMVGLRWLAPGGMRAVPESLEEVAGGVRYSAYEYTSHGTGSAAVTVRISADDLIVFQRPGLAEGAAWTSATWATRLAGEVLRGIGETQDTIFDNNALPNIIIKVPRGTQPEEVGRLQERFGRWFNRRARSLERPVAGVDEAIEIDTINVTPADMAMGELSETKIREILAAHDVPESVAYSGAANYATALSDTQAFVRTIGGRMETVARTINRDPDFQAWRLELAVYPDRHYSQKRDEQMASTSVANYVAAGFTTAAASWLVLGMEPEDWPEWIDSPYQAESLQPDDATPPPSMQAAAADEAVRSLFGAGEQHADDMRRFKRWYGKRLGADVDEFESKFLTHADKVVAADEVMRDAIERYP